MASNTIAILVVGVVGALLCAALTLITLGARGRWRRCEPCCARCSQLVGRYEVADAKRCPECGNSLEGRGGVRFFARRLRPLLIVGGAVLLVVAVVAPAAGTLLFGGAGVPAAFASTPTASLLDRVADSKNANRNWMLAELWARAQVQVQPGPPGTVQTGAVGGRAPLTRAELDRFLDIVAAFGPRDSIRNDPQLASLLVHAKNTGALTEQKAAAIANAWFPPDQLLAPPFVARRGAPLRLLSNDGIAPLPLASRVWISGVAIDEQPLALQRFPSARSEWADLQALAMTAIDAAPGKHTLRAKVHRELVFDGFASMAGAASPPGAAPHGGNALASTDLSVEVPFEVIAADAPSFIPLASPSARREEVRRACRVREVAIDDHAQSGQCIVHGSVVVEPVTDLRLSFDVAVVIDGVEAPLGWTMVHGTANGSSSSSSLGGRTIPCPNRIPDTVTVTFRPAPMHAERTPDADSVWGESIEVHDVPVRSTRRRAAEERTK